MFIWLVALALLAPELLVLNTEPTITIPELTILLTRCAPLWERHNQKYYEFIKMALLYFLPFIVMGIAYGNIVKKLWSKKIPTELGEY